MIWFLAGRSHVRHLRHLDVYALVGTSSPARIQSNCKALDIPLSEGQCQWLDMQRDEP